MTEPVALIADENAVLTEHTQLLYLQNENIGE